MGFAQQERLRLLARGRISFDSTLRLVWLCCGRVGETQTNDNNGFTKVLALPAISANCFEKGPSHSQLWCGWHPGLQARKKGGLRQPKRNEADTGRRSCAIRYEATKQTSNVKYMIVPSHCYLNEALTKKEKFVFCFGDVGNSQVK
jgi:hypothetical protein